MSIQTNCEWDQYVILDPPQDDIEYGKKTKNVYKNSSDFYYRRKYSEYNPLEILYETEEEDNYDDTKITVDISEKNHLKIDSKKALETFNNILYWSSILAKSAFTYFVVYTLFVI